MYETLGLGVDFQFRNSGANDIYRAMADMNNLYNTANRTGDGINNLSDQFSGFANSLKGLGLASMIEGIGVSLGNFFAIAKASDYESAFTGALKYMSDTSPEGIRKFNESLSDSAKWLGITKTAVLDATKEYMAMGLEQAKALEMAKAVSYAGQVWDVLPAEAASAFKGIAAAYNMDMLAEDTRNNFIDMVNTVADYTALSGQDTLNFLSAAGAGLKLIGRTDMDGAMGIAAAARKAEVDITHLGYGMRQITKTYADKGDKIFKTIGVNVRDATGQLKPFDKAMAEASLTIKNYSEDVQSAFAMDLGQRYSDDLLRVLGGWSEYEKTMEIIGNGQYAGSAAKEWDKIIQTFAYNANVTKTIWADMIQNTYGSLLPVLSAILKPFNAVFNVVVEFLGAHPLIGKMIAGFNILLGLLLLVGGAVMFFGTKLAIMVTRIESAGGFIKVFSGGLRGFGALMSGLTPLIAGFIRTMTRFSLTFGAIYFAWKYDIFGIRSLLESFTNGISTAFKNSKDLVQKNAMAIRMSLADMDVSNNFVDRLTAFCARIKIAWDSILDMWSDYTLSDEMYDKLVASGMLPVVTNFMMLVYRLRECWNGFKVGFTNGCTTISNVIKAVLVPPFNFLKNYVLLPLSDALMYVAKKIGILSESSVIFDKDATKWRKFGEAVGFVTSMLLACFAVSKIGAIFTMIGTAVSFVGKGFGLLLAPIKFVGGAMLSAFGDSRLLFAMQSVIGGAANIREALAYLVEPLTSFGTRVVGVFTRVGTFMLNSPIGRAIIGLRAGVLSLPEAFALSVSPILNAVNKIGVGIGKFVENAKILGTAIRVLGTQALGASRNFIATNVAMVSTRIQMGLTAISSSRLGMAIGGAATRVAAFAVANRVALLSVLGILGPIIAIAMYMHSTGTSAEEMGAKITNFTNMIVTGIQNFSNALPGMVNSFVTSFTGIINSFVAVLPQLINSLVGAIPSLINAFVSILTNVVGMIPVLIPAIMQGLVALITGVVSSLSTIMGPLIQGFVSLITAVVGMLPTLLPVVIQGFITLFMGIVQAATLIIVPLVSAIPTIILALVNALIQATPVLIDGAFQLLNALIMAIPLIIPPLINALPQILMAITNALIQAIPMLIQCAVQLFMAIVRAIPQIIPPLIGAIPQIIRAIITSLGPLGSELLKSVGDAFNGAKNWLLNSFIPGLSNVGKKIIDTIASGIRNAGSAIWDAIKSKFGAVEKWLFPHSNAKTGPFSNLTGAGAKIIDTMAKGVAENGNAIYDEMNKLNIPEVSVDTSYNTFKRTTGIVDYNINKSGLTNSSLPQLVGNVDLSAKVSGVNEMCDNITVVFMNILTISKAVADNFARVQAVVPSYDGTAYARKLNNVYDTRIDNTRVGSSDKIESFEIKDGAIQIHIHVDNPDGVNKAIPKMKQELRDAVLDIIKDLKDERYED